MCYRRFIILEEKDIKTVLCDWGYRLFGHSYVTLNEALEEHPETFEWEPHEYTFDEPYFGFIGVYCNA